MMLNPKFELSMTLNTNKFQRVFDNCCNKSLCLEELDNGEYADRSLAAKGITVIFRDSQYKKKVRLLVNPCVALDDPSDIDRLIRKLDKHIFEHFDRRYTLNDFILSGMTITGDIDVGSRVNVCNYLKVIRRVGRVKGFSPICYECFDDKASFCLSGNSNDTDFLLYGLEKFVADQLRSADAGQKKLQTAGEQTKGILRAEVRLTKQKAIREYTDTTDTSDQIVEMMKNSKEIFIEIFARVVPFGDFYKMDAAVEIVRSEVKDHVMRRKMLRLLALIPEKKSLHLAQKAMNCRDVEKVMDAFAKLCLSPVTISKRHEVKQLECLYEYILGKKQ